MTEGLGRRILRETASFAALQVLGSVFVWATTLALTRLLDPRAFGVYAIGTFFLGLGTLLGDGGLGATLLRKREDIRAEELRAALTFLVGLGGAMSVALLLSSPWICRIYHLDAAETDVRDGAAWAIGAATTPAARTLLEARLRTETDPTVRMTLTTVRSSPILSSSAPSLA